MEPPRSIDVAAVGTLDEPTRRALYEHVVGQPAPVSRDEAAAALGLPRTTAAFHLDRLVSVGLLTTSFARRTGRTGPGAGRPAKLYQRSRTEVAVSLPPRRYDLVGELLAAALEDLASTDDAPNDVLGRRAYAAGHALAGRSQATEAAAAGPGPAREAAVKCLQDLGYEPRVAADGVTLVNCPFHDLARNHTDLVCGANLRLVDGLLDGVADRASATGLVARLRPEPGHCCVRLEDDVVGDHS